jgi:hypothetical protein
MTLEAAHATATLEVAFINHSRTNSLLPLECHCLADGDVEDESETEHEVDISFHDLKRLALEFVNTASKSK